jgi:AraC-like DNA-binding protein
MSGLLTIREWEQVARDAEFSPAKMATLCAISERQLQRLFRQHLRCTPSRWLRELQCRLAKQLISKGYTNKAAAAELKFSNEAHFCREFKKVFGTSPRSFAPVEDGVLRTPQARKISKKSWSVLSDSAGRTPRNPVQ